MYCPFLNANTDSQIHRCMVSDTGFVMPLHTATVKFIKLIYCQLQLEAWNLQVSKVGGTMYVFLEMLM